MIFLFVIILGVAESASTLLEKSKPDPGGLPSQPRGMHFFRVPDFVENKTKTPLKI